jgi:signal-transduction protein with cAMP-binding, CBS, and nucleotidyltransferase domain
MDLDPLARLDSFPYRHQLNEVMTHPVIKAGENLSVRLACLLLREHGISSLLVLDQDGRIAGLVSDSEIIARLAERGAVALDLTLGEIMTSPVHQLSKDSFLYLAIARMDRLGLTHLVVIDRTGAPVGMVTAGQLLKVRARRALLLGDQISEATSAVELAAAIARLPALARGLRDDGASATAIAAVVAGALRDATGRASALTEQTLIADGWGGPPAPFCVLVLGSAGRGESLLAFDQDNALIYQGSTGLDAWFAEFGRRLNDLLDRSGLPLCRGEVMARNPFWRRSLADWEREVRSWVFNPEMQTLLDVDIFFDMVPVHGERGLADHLRAHAFELAGQSGFFLQLLTQSMAKLDSPIGAFGRLNTQDGALDGKKYGLFPLVTTARARAIQAGIRVAGTADRFRALADAGKLHEEDLASLLAAHEEVLGAVLTQQLADLADGRPATTRIVPASLPRTGQRRLLRALQRVKLLRDLGGSQMGI